jgi:adenylate cyclase
LQLDDGVKEHALPGSIASSRPRIVTRDEIIAAVWLETVVEDNNLNMQIAALRRVLDEGRTAPGCIQTVPRRGYRFVSPVVRGGDPAQLWALCPSGSCEPVHSTDHLQGPQSRRPNLPRRTITAGVVVGMLMLVAAVTTISKVAVRRLLRPAPAPLSIVVLPFTNLAGDPGQQYFVDAITEDLTTDLSRFADMRVISRDTAFTYRNKPVSAKSIGRELGVRYVIEGSVQRSGDQVRINARLINAETDTHLWAERFDRSLGDLLTLQNEITGHITAALSPTLVASEAARTEEHADALDHIFKGRAEMFKPASRRNFAKAIAEYERALALDPSSVEAQGRLAIALANRALDDMSDTTASDLEWAHRLVKRAMGTAPRSPLLHFAKAQLLRARHRCDAAIPEYEAVLAANRNALAAIGNIGRCKIYLGQIDDGVALEEQAIRLSPHDPFRAVWYFRIGQARLLQSRVDEAIRWLDKAHDEHPAFPFVAAWLAAAYGLKGDLSQAAAELAEARSRSRNGAPTSIAAERSASIKDFTSPVTQALLRATYLAGLRRAGVPED